MEHIKTLTQKLLILTDHSIQDTPPEDRHLSPCNHPTLNVLHRKKKQKTSTVIVFSMFAIELYLNSFRCCLSCVHIHLHPSVITALGLENVCFDSSTVGCYV